MKPEYGPTLGRLLSPRWRAASPLARGAVIAAGVGAAGAGRRRVALTLENATLLARRERAVQLHATGASTAWRPTPAAT